MKFRPGKKLIIIHLLMLAVVAGPFLLFGDWFDQFAIDLMAGQRKQEMFLATAGLLAADVFIPVPSSAISVSAGMLLGMPLAFLATLLGLTVGCYTGYAFGFYFRRVHFDRWSEDKEFRNLSAEFSRHGYLVLLGCRSIPLLAEMSVIVAGFHRYPFLKFSLVTLVANVLLAGLYAFLGENALQLSSIYLVIVLLFIVPLITIGLRLFWVRRFASTIHPQGE